MNEIKFTGTIQKAPKVYGSDKRRVLFNIKVQGKGRFSNFLFTKCFGQLAEDLIDQGVEDWAHKEVRVEGTLEAENWARDGEEDNWVTTVWANKLELTEETGDEPMDQAPF